MKQYRIDGGGVQSIADLYQQFNRELMAEQHWILSPTLGGLNDVLYRIDNEIRDGVPASFVWIDHAHCRDVLGFDETQLWLNSKLAKPISFNKRGIQSDLDKLQQGIGKTYFEIVLEFFADHPLIEPQLR